MRLKDPAIKSKMLKYHSKVPSFHIYFLQSFSIFLELSPTNNRQFRYFVIYKSWNDTSKEEKSFHNRFVLNEPQIRSERLFIKWMFTKVLKSLDTILLPCDWILLTCSHMYESHSRLISMEGSGSYDGIRHKIDWDQICNVISFPIHIIHYP